MENKTLLILVVIVLVLVLSSRLLYNNVSGNKVIDKFSSGNLVSGNQETLIRNTIDDLINRRFSNLKIQEATSGDEMINEINTFHLDLDAPLGMISHFYGDPNPPNEIYWKECNGETILSSNSIYTSFFELYDEITGTQNTEYTLPNIVGRTIVGAGQISTPRLSENNSSVYGSSKPFHHNQSNINLAGGQTGGYDVCPSDTIETVARASADETNGVTVCKNMSNMPPHIYMTAWMKVRNKKFRISF